MDHSGPGCARCPIKISDRVCREKNGKHPDFCPTANLSDLTGKSLDEYKNDPLVNEFARQASIQEGSGYGNRDQGYEHVRPIKTRIEEIIEFAGRMNYKRLGMAFCVGLRREAKAVENLIVSRGFEMVSVVCKVGRSPKEIIGIRRDEQIDGSRDEAMCNPILQAMVLNREKTEFNILLGLCVGHDSMFFKYSGALCTVLGSKGPGPRTQSAGRDQQSGQLLPVFEVTLAPDIEPKVRTTLNNENLFLIFIGRCQLGFSCEDLVLSYKCSALVTMTVKNTANS